MVGAYPGTYLGIVRMYIPKQQPYWSPNLETWLYGWSRWTVGRVGIADVALQYSYMRPGGTA